MLTGDRLADVRTDAVIDAVVRLCLPARARNYLGFCDVISGVSMAAIRLSAARALPATDNVEIALRLEDGWTTRWNK